MSIFAVPTKTIVEFDRSVFTHGRRKFKLFDSPLQKAGAMVQRKAKDLVRKTPQLTKTGRLTKSSKPGKPPKSRGAGHPLRRIFFAASEAFGTGSVFVGPVGFGANSPVTELHEHGGQRRRRVLDFSGRRSRFSRKRTRGRKKLVTYKPRPYMQPALEKKAPQIAKLWKGALN